MSTIHHPSTGKLSTSVCLPMAISSEKSGWFNNSVIILKDARRKRAMALPASRVPFMGVKFTEQDKSVVLNSEPSLQMPYEDFQATPCQPGAMLWFSVFSEKLLIFTSTPKTCGLPPN